MFAVCLNAQVVLRINNAAPITLPADDLAKLARHTAVLNFHGKQTTYEGPLLHDVLAKGGIDFGKELKGPQLSTYVSAIANDGYQVVFALAEFDPTVMDSGIILADKGNGQALGANEGPVRIVAPHELRPTRSIRMVKEIDVVQLKQ
jgi:hypothetical protein